MHRALGPRSVAALSALTIGAGAALAAPQSGALRHDGPRWASARSVMPVVHARASTAVDPREATRDARMAALRARLDALEPDAAELDDVEQRVVVFDGGGTLAPIHRDTLATYVGMLRIGGVTVVAEACAPADDAGGARLHGALARAFESVGAPSWTIVAQHAPCSLPGGVVLRPAR